VVKTGSKRWQLDSKTEKVTLSPGQGRLSRQINEYLNLRSILFKRTSDDVVFADKLLLLKND